MSDNRMPVQRIFHEERIADVLIRIEFNRFLWDCYNIAGEHPSTTAARRQAHQHNKHKFTHFKPSDL